MEQRLEKHCQSFQAINCVWHSGFRKILSFVNNYIKQQIEKGFSMHIYDFKFTTYLALHTAIH
ncbi:hypothetical protein [Pedobacter endophyticus]